MEKGIKRINRYIADTSASTGETLLPWRKYKAAREEEYLVKLMMKSRGCIKTACRISGLSKARLYQLLNRYGIFGY